VPEMILSHAKKFVVLQPWKTASSTMFSRLGHWNESPYRRFFYFNPHLKRIAHQHITYADFLALPEGRLGYFTASFIRNPYDRVYSAFRQVQKDLRLQPNAVYPEPWIREHVARQLAENLDQLKRAGFDFDRWVDSLSDEQVFESGRNSNLPLHPAHYWTHVNGSKSVSFVGRVENFEQDFSALLQHLGITGVESINANVVELTGNSAANPFGYRYVDRMTKQTIEKISRLFARDFELFGYEMVRA
jgi:hypothetical protein